MTKVTECLFVWIGGWTQSLLQNTERVQVGDSAFHVVLLEGLNLDDVLLHHPVVHVMLHGSMLCAGGKVSEVFPLKRAIRQKMTE